MPLISCPDCSREVSDKADACPQCAFPIAKGQALSSSTVVCLGCQRQFNAGDELCPHCGLFNSQKYNKPEPQAHQVTQAEPMDSDVVRCPKCGSKNVAVMKEGFKAGDACCGALLVGPLGLLCGAKDANKLNRHCLKCGKKWSL